MILLLSQGDDTDEVRWLEHVDCDDLILQNPLSTACVGGMAPRIRLHRCLQFQLVLREQELLHLLADVPLQPLDLLAHRVLFSAGTVNAAEFLFLIAFYQVAVQ